MPPAATLQAPITPPAQPPPAPITKAIERWFSKAARDLPWRTTPRDPYRSLVSEFMLQQTQVSRVLEHFEPFLERFPTLADLAAADEAAVLAQWSGLGYYRRARALHAAARAITHRFAGQVPADTTDLRTLPGVGPYTAGAITSIVFDQPAPIVDGNIARVLLRLNANPAQPADKQTTDWAWARAADLVETSTNPAACNEGLMELGATICTPRNPRCDRCPLRAHCASLARGLTEEIPTPKPRATRRDLFCASILATNSKTQHLIERRPDAGMWANMFQAPTLESDDAEPDAAEVARFVGAKKVERIASFVHQTTHRIVRFTIWHATAARAGAGRTWKTKTQIARLPLSNAQRRILLETPETQSSRDPSE